MIRTWILAAALAVATVTCADAQTLAAVKQRGTLNCGVSQGFAGFSAPDSRGEFRGLDADYCRALAFAPRYAQQGPGSGSFRGPSVIR